MVAQVLTNTAFSSLAKESASAAIQGQPSLCNEQRLAGYFDHLLDTATEQTDQVYQELDEKLAQVSVKIDEQLQQALWQDVDTVISQQRMTIVGQASTRATSLQHLMDLIQMASSLPHSRLKQLVLAQCQSLLARVQ